MVTYKKKRYTCKDTGKKSGKKPICKAVAHSGGSDGSESCKAACEKMSEGATWCTGKWEEAILRNTCKNGGFFSAVDFPSLCDISSDAEANDDGYNMVDVQICCRTGCRGSDSDRKIGIEETRETEKANKPTAFQKLIGEFIKKYFPMKAEFATPIR